MWWKDQREKNARNDRRGARFLYYCAVTVLAGSRVRLPSIYLRSERALFLFRQLLQLVVTR
jgi:hypothetical protein